MRDILLRFGPYLLVFGFSLLLTFVLTPIVRELNRHFGMVDKPDPRRINKVPIPRGGGLAIVLGVTVSYWVFVLFANETPLQGRLFEIQWKLSVLSTLLALIGLADDKFSLQPLVKLLGQVIVAFGVWWWVDLGFADIFPSLPAALDCFLTVFWIVGAVNAFNLIDGLDGLATGLGFIAILGLTGSLFFTRNLHTSFYCFAILGGLLGFLRYNYHPASVFLGDCGSMYIGFLVATLPLYSHDPHSVLVSVGVPLLAMGVPIFDTSLAILRRTIRHFLNRQLSEDAAGNGKVMTADSDHLHHRLLRAFGMNQRRVAWTLYGTAAVAVLVGIVGVSLKSETLGLWLLALAGASCVIFRDMASVELFDTGRLLNVVAHNPNTAIRRRFARFAVPFFIGGDLLILAGAFILTARMLRFDLSQPFLRLDALLRIVCVFAALIFFRAYSTAWSRAVASNYCRLFLATFFGSLVGAAAVVFASTVVAQHVLAFTLVYAVLTFVGILTIRIFRGLVRDLFYAIDCARLRERKNVSRILVYGAGLRYRSFRRELVRKTSANERMIVGILDDDLTLVGKYIGGIRVLGTLNQAPRIINDVNADAVVIACEISDEWLAIVRKTLASTGVRITHFTFSEKAL